MHARTHARTHVRKPFPGQGTARGLSTLNRHALNTRMGPQSWVGSIEESNHPSALCRLPSAVCCLPSAISRARGERSERPWVGTGHSTEISLGVISYISVAVTSLAAWPSEVDNGRLCRGTPPPPPNRGEMRRRLSSLSSSSSSSQSQSFARLACRLCVQIAFVLRPDASASAQLTSRQMWGRRAGDCQFCFS
jgi:hypothetical protein